MKYRREEGVKFNHKGRARLSQDLGKEGSKIKQSHSWFLFYFCRGGDLFLSNPWKTINLC